jgi:hypothetical protein
MATHNSLRLAEHYAPLSSFIDGLRFFGIAHRTAMGWDRQQKRRRTRIIRERSGKNYRPGIIRLNRSTLIFPETQTNSVLVCILLG